MKFFSFSLTRSRVLSEIWIYPVKSLGGVRVRKAHVRQKGLQYDRRWMLVDSDNDFMTQRNYPNLALFKVQFLSQPGSEISGIKINHGDSFIELPFNRENMPYPILTRVWEDEVTTFEVSEEHSRWFSEQVGAPCKLVSFPEHNPRPVDNKYQVNGEQVSLADGFPLLVIGQASLDDLNKRLKKPLPMNRFRPNLVFSGGQAYEEDSWKNFRVGKNRFMATKNCGRCITTTTNQETGERGSEPLLTLSRYRKKDNNVYFGKNAIALDEYEINEGDKIFL